MADLIYIDGNLVNPELVEEFPDVIESAALATDINIPDSIEIMLNDVGGVHNPLTPGSLLYGRGTKFDVDVFSEELNRYTFRGKCSDVNVKHSTRSVTISATSNLDSVKDASCFLNATDITPAEAIRRILTDPVGTDETSDFSLDYPLKTAKGLLSEDDINTALFDDVKAYQEANHCLVNVALDNSDSDNNNSSIGDLIGNLLRHGHCGLYTYAGLICIYQWKKSGSVSGYTLNASDIISASITWHYSQDEAYAMKNAYRIAYVDGTAVLWASDQDDDSVRLNGKFQFGIPDEAVHSSGSEDYSVIMARYLGARWCGNMAMSRFGAPTKEFTFIVPYGLEHLNIGMVVTLGVAPYTGMNMVIVERRVRRMQREIDLTCIVI